MKISILLISIEKTCSERSLLQGLLYHPEEKYSSEEYQRFFLKMNLEKQLHVL